MSLFKFEGFDNYTTYVESPSIRVAIELWTEEVERRLGQDKEHDEPRQITNIAPDEKVVR